jgi:hypothetical protein
MIDTNEQKLIEISVQAQVQTPASNSAYQVAADGTAYNVPFGRGICHSVKIGDSVFGWQADHVTPGVCAENPDMIKNKSLCQLVCIGNQATIISGDAKGETGIVTGLYGSFMNTGVILHFKPETLDKLDYNNTILIRAVGRGLVLNDFPQIKMLAIGPQLLKAMPLESRDGKLVVPVAARIPAHLMGDGIGPTSERGDFEIMTSDKQELADHELEKLSLGDLVAVMDYDNRFGRCFRRGAITIGVVVHGDSQWAGHGPGVTALFTIIEPVIQPELVREANIANYLNLL